IPIFMTRLVADNGCSMIGGPIPPGNCAPACWSRSCTSCRACNRSVPRLNRSTIWDSAFTDLERTTSSPGVPRSSSSIGTVISSSTSAVDIPMPSVWTSTSDGATSGKTSTGMCRTWFAPIATIAMATAITRKRNLRLEPMIQRNIRNAPYWPVGLLPKFLFDAEQFGRPGRHDFGAGVRTLQQNRAIALDVFDLDAMAYKNQGLGIGVSPAVTRGIVEHRGVGDY